MDMSMATLKEITIRKVLKMAIAPNFISPAIPQSYAAQQNAQYNHTGSKYVDLKQRFNDTIAALQPMKASGVRSQLKNAIAVFQKNNPLVKCFEDLQLCVAGLTPMSDILIDITIQRILNLTWVIEIIKNFREPQADPIKLYEIVAGGDLAKI